MSVCCLVHVFRKPGELLAARERHTHTHTHTPHQPTHEQADRERESAQRASERARQYVCNTLHPWPDPGRPHPPLHPPC